MNNNITIEYDENIISKIKEMIEEGWKKIINFIKLQNKGLDQNPNFDFYQELTRKLNKISIELEELNLLDELKYFLSISHMVKYIVYENSSDSSFGHCCFAVDLLKFFLHLFNFRVQIMQLVPHIFQAEKICSGVCNQMNYQCQKNCNNDE